MKRLAFCFLIFGICLPATAEENVRKIGTWNMKWLGGTTGSHLDPVENVGKHADYIRASGATLIALQEITPSHSVNGKARCHYLDLIVKHLNGNSDNWTYRLDRRNGSQRLAFLFDKAEWKCFSPRTVYPGGSFRGRLRRPFVAKFHAVGTNAKLQLHVINVHMKAFPDEKSRDKRVAQFDDFKEWIATHTLDQDVIICGDTNIYADEQDTDAALVEIDYVRLWDGEPTSIHENRLSQRFDRFYASAGIMPEIDSAKTKVGDANYIDAHTVTTNEEIAEFDRDISDHFIVTLTIDVSEERDE